MNIILSEPKNTSITLQTKTGRNIENAQFFEINPSERQYYDKYKREYINVAWRTPPSPEYNCHGLTFASRRTGIDLPAEVAKIISDDGYKEVLSENVLPGDIVLYYDESGDIEHSGVVVRSPEQPINMPMVFSKWGSYSEGVHAVYNCPYSKDVRYYRMNYEAKD